MPSFKPYSGSARKLVLGIDVGTTYSGVSYAILDPGEVPKIQGLTRFPGQENAAGDSKIPSIMYYRQDGTVHSVGAEAALPGVEMEAEDEELIFVQWFKLHLRPDGLDSGEVKKRDLPPLPPGKTVLDVFADFLGYLFQCARRYVAETHASGESLWGSFEDRIEFVLAHPNGWEGLQQSKMRQAAVAAGLVPGTAAGHARVHFVTEGEASLHFCIQSGLTADAVETGGSVMIVDAGGGTVDISSYSFTAITPLSVEEVAPADCILQGSTRVNVRAERYLKDLLKDSAYGNDEDIKTMLDFFDKNTKPIFKDSETSYIKFGSMRCNDPSVKIRRGQLTLSGTEMQSFFKPALDGIVEAVQRQRQASSRPISTVFLVGGFAASPWLYASLQTALRELRLTLCRPDTHTNKAVSEGALSFFLENFVASRIIRTTYGVDVFTNFDPFNPEHIARKHKKFTHPIDGLPCLTNRFSALITKGTPVCESSQLRKSYIKWSLTADKVTCISMDILSYKGKSSRPQWTDVEPERYAPLCTEIDVILLCGLTELQAQIGWIENGVEKRGPATIIYDDELEEPSRV